MFVGICDGFIIAQASGFVKSGSVSGRFLGVSGRISGRNVADLIVETRKNGAAVLYDLVNIYEKEIAEAPVTMASHNDSQRRQDAPAEDIISQNPKMSTQKSDFSLENSANDEARSANQQASGARLENDVLDSVALSAA